MGQPLVAYDPSFEMGLADKIPDRALDAYQTASRKHYIDVFPLKEEEIPAGCDPTRHICCFCALGTAMQIFEARGLRSDEVFPVGAVVVRSLSDRRWRLITAAKRFI